ncbi:ABC transporter ATP-binding protein [Flavobacteriaceae bacterium]|nr:ABC transporter ATP-binding protein [Flavobacteriaceae bacterium]
MISCKAIHKQYGELEVLKGIDLEIEEGEVVAIVGPSGAGKTTLLQILGTLDSPTSSEGTCLIIADKDTQKLSEKEMALFRNENLGFIFQFHELLPEFTALENVCMPGWIGNRKEEDLERDATALLSQLGLADRTHHKPQEMSGGEQQRVAVARALINKPKVVFADEPSGNLDSENALYLHELFFNLRDQLGCTFVIVTHNEELAERVDRKISLKDGKIIS